MLTLTLAEFRDNSFNQDPFIVNHFAELISIINKSKHIPQLLLFPRKHPMLPDKQEHHRASEEAPLPDCIGHAVRTDSSHYAQALQSWLVLPFLGKLLLFRTLRFNKLLPPFCRTLNIPIQVSEFFHRWESLENSRKVFRRTILYVLELELFF